MALSDISSPEAVEAAIREYDSIGRDRFLAKYRFEKAREYYIAKNDRLYDSKAIIGAAHGYQFPELGPLAASDFSGGDPTLRKLSQLHFVVTKVDPELSDGENASGSTARPSVWVEKTIVANRPDRIEGDFALGKMLWSPQKGEDGKDIYRFMREVRPGDVVLHLTDNEGFTGISVADSAAEEFNGVPNTTWSDRPGYFVRLRNYQKLDPPLHRDNFLRNATFRDRMLGLLANGLTNTFYARDGNLNQGKYLTPAPADLISILNDAYVQIAGRKLIEGDSGKYEIDTVSPAPIPSPASNDLSAIVASFSSALRESHISFGNRHEEVARTFIASLASKRFVILTGLSGSGKTQLAVRFGEWLGENRSRVIPVRPDWTGPEQLLGYEDALLPLVGTQRAWHVPDALSFILKAARDSARPYLLILDEMNLAHVERYFADVLSGMESNEPCIPNLVDDNGSWHVKTSTPPKITFPANLFLVGTVNVDETTYAFSPKVLDRANTIEFRVLSTDLDPNAQKPIACEPGPEHLVTQFLEISRNNDWHLTHPSREPELFKSHLLALHAILTDGRFEFGHRVFYEALRFASMIDGAGAQGPLEALDFFILQKILPRLHGSRRNLEPILNALEAFTKNPNSLDSSDAEHLDPILARSHSRIRRFKQILSANQFASFTD